MNTISITLVERGTSSYYQVSLDGEKIGDLFVNDGRWSFKPEYEKHSYLNSTVLRRIANEIDRLVCT